MHLHTLKHALSWYPFFLLFFKGTKNSRVYIYELKLNYNFHKDEEDDFLLKEIKEITPHCKVVSMIKANEEYFVTVPETDD